MNPPANPHQAEFNRAYREAMQACGRLNAELLKVKSERSLYWSQVIAQRDTFIAIEKVWERETGKPALLLFQMAEVDPIYSELDALRAAAAERDALQAAVNEAREIISGIDHDYPIWDYQDRVDAWLAAHPATPAPEQGGEK